MSNFTLNAAYNLVALISNEIANIEIGGDPENLYFNTEEQMMGNEWERAVCDVAGGGNGTSGGGGKLRCTDAGDDIF